MHDWLPVKAYLAHIGMVPDGSYERCSSGVEDLLHCLRDCRSSKAVWESILPPHKSHLFFIVDCNRWLLMNLDDHERIPSTLHMNWVSLFLATPWMIWKERNTVYFNHAPFSIAKVLKQAQPYAWDMQTQFESFNGFGLDLVNGRWLCSPPGYFKLNIDGSMRDGRVTYDGLLRDHEGS